MKRSILFLLILVIVVLSVFSAEYTAYDEASSEFKMLLNKIGTNLIWFSEDENGNSAVPDNRHIFPLVESSTASFYSDIYFHWILDDTANAIVSLSFVSSEVDYQNAKYMLENMSPSESAEDMNYDVTMSSIGSDTSIIKTIKNSGDGGTVGTLLSERTLSDMTITLSPDVKERHFKIRMTICPAYSINGASLQFMEAQYAGYIVAELKYN